MNLLLPIVFASFEAFIRGAAMSKGGLPVIGRVSGWMFCTFWAMFWTSFRLYTLITTSVASPTPRS